jgi:hypothetical protein
LNAPEFLEVQNKLERCMDFWKAQARAQQALCGSPKFLKVGFFDRPMDEGLFRKLGVVFGEQADDLLINVQLPAGWRITPEQKVEHWCKEENTRWCNLLDDKGWTRADIYYSTRFPREAWIEPCPRFTIECHLKVGLSLQLQFSTTRNQSRLLGTVFSKPLTSLMRTMKGETLAIRPLPGLHAAACVLESTIVKKTQSKTSKETTSLL